MLDLALERVASEDSHRRVELLAFRDEIVAAHAAAEKRDQERKARLVCHFGMLPVELATEIFALALANHPAHVVLLAGVCRTWRHTIISTPSLWSTVVLSSRNGLKKIRTWKERSRNRFVEISILTRDDLVLKELQDIVWSKLRRLILRGIVPETRVLLSSIVPATIFSHLDVLDAEADGLMRPFPWLNGDSQSSLSTLTLSDISLDWEGLSNACHDLQSLTLHYIIHKFPPLHRLRSLLHSNPKLSKLDLYSANISSVYSSENGEDIPAERRLPELLRLPSLLELRVKHQVAVPAFLTSFTAPFLEKLYLEMSYGSIDYYLDYLHAMGSTATLKELRLQHCALTAANMIAFLEHANALEFLELSHLGGNQANLILEELATRGRSAPSSPDHGPSQRPPLCPSLQYVNLSHCPDIKSGPLVRLVKNRLPLDGGVQQESQESTEHPPTVTPITTLVVDGCNGVDPEILPWLRSKVPTIRCVYLTKKQANWKR